MWPRHVALRRVAGHVRTTFTARVGGRAFSSGLVRAEASQEESDTSFLIRRTSSSWSPARSRTNHTVPNTHGKRDSVTQLTAREHETWIAEIFRPHKRIRKLCSIDPDSTYQSEDLGSKLPEDLRRDPLSAFTDESNALDISTAGECIRLYIYGLLEQSRDLDALQKCLERDQAGVKALYWLLKTAKHEELDATYSFKFIQATALCIVGQDKTDVWWDMLEIDHAPKSLNDSAISDMVYSRMRWQNALTVALFEAQLFWTKQDCCFDAPLQSFLRIHRRNAGKRPSDRLSVVAACSWITTKLIFFDKSNTSVKDYDAFVNFLKGYYRTTVDGRYHVGLFELMHPTHRRADALLGYLRNAKDNEEAMLHLRSLPRGRLWLVFLNLIGNCHSVGRTADVRWAIDFFEEVMREKRRQNTQGAGDRDAWSQRSRKASKSELAQGVEVRPDGRIAAQYAFRETLEEAQQREKKLASKVRSPLQQPLHASRAAADTNSKLKKKAPVREGSVTYRPSV